MVKIRDKVTLSNGNEGYVWHVHEYGYIASDMNIGSLEIIFTSENPIQPIFEHKCTKKLSQYEACKQLDIFSSKNIDVVNMIATMGGIIIFYKEETEQSKLDRLGKKLESIFDNR